LINSYVRFNDVSVLVLQSRQDHPSKVRDKDHIQGIWTQPLRRLE